MEKIYSKIILVGLLLVSTFSACINDKFAEPDSNTPMVDLYISLQVKLPSNTLSRGETNLDGSSTNGILDGTTIENELTSAALYFVDQDSENKNVVLILNPPQTTLPLEKNISYELTYLVKTDNIKSIAGKKLELYLIGNPETLSNHDLGFFVNPMNATFTISDAESSPIGDFGTTGQTMPLVNKKKYEIDFTDVTGGTDQEIMASLQTKFDFDNNNTFILKDEPLELERAVARFDIADKENNNNFKYRIDGTTLDLKLFSLQPYNVSNKSYLYRHTVNGNENGTAFTSGCELSLLEDERGTDGGYNWIANPDWDLTNKTKKTPDNYYNKLKTGFNFTNDNNDIITGVEGSSSIYSLSDITVNGHHSYTAVHNGKIYYPFCYVTENTIPSVELMTGMKLWEYGTGVAFTFQILDIEGKPITTSTLSEKYPKEITKKSAEENTLTITLNNGLWVDVEYDTKNGGYYLTYYAFIKHNDSSSIKAMEYAVVRNNVYQLSVKSVSNIPNPNDPESFYLSLDIKVLAWAKRDISVSW